jgi:hypothetical protein
VRCLPPDGGAAIEQSWRAVAGSGPSSLVTGVPDGSACTVDEDTPTPPADHVWQPPVISPNSFVATAGTTVAVRVLNTLDPSEVVPPTEPPTPPVTPPVTPPTVPPTTPPVTPPGGGDHADGGLAFTGADVLPLAGLAGALVAGGLVAMVIRASRRRRRG